MQEERFVVQFISENNCFAYLPESWLRQLRNKPNILKLRHNESDYYLSWYFVPGPSNCLCIGTKFAAALNIKENEDVFASCVAEAPALSSIIATPQSAHDREILELQLDRVQSNLLDQITIVAKSQPIVVWVSKFCSITLIVNSLEPNFSYGRLVQYTEVHIEEKIQKENILPQLSSSTQILEKYSWLKNCWSSLKNSAATSNADDIDCTPSLDKYKYKEMQQVYRVHVLPNDFTQSPCHVFVSRSHVSRIIRDSVERVGSAFCKIRKIREERGYTDEVIMNYLRKEDSGTLKMSSDFYVKLFIIEDLEQCLKEHFSTVVTKTKCIFISTDLSTNLKVKVGGKIILELFEESPMESISSIEIFPLDENVTREVFVDYVQTRSTSHLLLLNSQIMLTLDNGSRCIFRILPATCLYGYFDKNRLDRINVDINSNVSKADNFQHDIETKISNIEMDKVCMRFIESIISECTTALHLGLGLHKIYNYNYKPENILICGEMGSGKTTVCKVIQEMLYKPPYYVHSNILECKFMKGKKAEMVQKIIMSVVAECIYYQYSVLVLDDIDSISTASSNDEESTPDSINAARITDIIFNTILEYQSVHCISLIATCKHISKIGQKLRTAHGNHFFRTVLTMPSLEKDNRIDILKLTLKSKVNNLSENIDWNYIGNNTESWVVQDLVDVAEKASFTALKRHIRDKNKSALCLIEDDLLSILKQHKPITLHGVELYKGKGYSWSDIGGLREVKNTLIEILYWPLKYSIFFKNAPIKQQSGVLLYGMPGTGKTMLAGAIAKECGLNLISVKGPELLSKYIGASEEAVRNIFEKAQRAKPCVLFFDEFDSLAPRRGHDSTGVTDRVVNQLLTQLDGVEGREGVAVVAASSRPDLLDPALLRPGRLDKSLLCPLPNQDDREEILQALCKSHGISSQNLNFQELAAATPGFTGADLNAVFAQAKLNVLEKVLAVSSKEQQDSMKSTDVSQSELLHSINMTQPSLNETEKEKYNKIYMAFSKGGSMVNDLLKNQKATLA